MKTALTIGGSDPSGGAGVQADLSAFSAFKVLGLSAIASLTAQNNREVKATLCIGPEFLEKQVSVLLEEFRVDAVKIGMLGTAENVRAVSGMIRRFRFKNIVLDPVLCSTGGYPLLKGRGLEEVKRLAGSVDMVTPNLDEASALSGIEAKNLAGMEEAARRIYSLGPGCVLVKGGHLKDEPIDLLFDGKGFIHFKGKRIRGRKEAFHGTGCILSSGIAAGLANGRTAEEAVREAKRHLVKVISGRM